MTEKICSVAIDGPSGAGKSTIARSVAKRFGFVYVDTGAIYRTVGLAVRRAGLDPKSSAQVESLLPGLAIELGYGEDGVQRMLLQGEDVSGLIRTPEISMYASDVSALPVVRAFLLDMQRSTARKMSVVMDGRDIGTVVLPDAGLKIFLTASPEARALRRHKELLEKGQSVTYEEVFADMAQRDHNDSTRAAAPLKPAEDSVYVDTTDLGLQESVDAVCALVKGRFAL